MKMILPFLLLVSSFIGFSQVTSRNEIDIPDIPGYITLKCDFHLHTVFSDGSVWPTTRVGEAWLDGLDAIALTDHLEYLPHKKDMVQNFNRPYEIAKGNANELNLILIKGAEVTREYPLGHNNCLFLSDVEALNKENPADAFNEALKQNAVFQWNHPGWRRPGGIPQWTDEQTNMYNKKQMQMIEIVNGTTYYPLAHKWALEKNIAISANSDIHDPIYMKFGTTIHRPITLVFAKERSEASIKEALLAGRTAIYHMDTLMGKEEFLKPIFNASLKVQTPKIRVIGKQWIAVILENTSDVPMMIEFTGGSDDFADVGNGLFIPAHQSARFTVKGQKEDFAGQRRYSIPCKIKNYWTAPGQTLNASFDFVVEFEKIK